jgi:tetratricopeptide (TPR) repeat protein
MSTYKERAIDCFYNKEFQRALFYFSLALKEDPEDKELRICAILADLALEREEEAMSLFEYYTTSARGENEENETMLEEIIDSLEVGMEKLLSLFETEFVDQKLQEENGIVYDDFMSLVEEQGDFKKAFEDIMFSTKVVISNKEDFLHFLDLLIDHGYVEMSLQYLESAVSMFPNDAQFHSLFRKAQGSLNQ